MKHAKKMVLVDINSIKTPSVSSVGVEDKTVNNLTKAISSLASSNEFSRSYFGDSATAISHLYNEMNKILEREDLKPDVKLKLYHDKLKRYLFLQRTSEEEEEGYVELTPPAPQRPVIELPNEQIIPELEISQEQEIQTPPVKTPVLVKNSRQKRLHRSNIPRLTPKELILRDPAGKQPPKYLDKYFLNWGATPKGTRKSTISSGARKARRIHHE